MVSYDLFLAALCGAVAFVLVREKTSPRPAGLRGRIRARGWGLLLLPIAVMAAVMAGGAQPLAVVEPVVAVVLVIWAPRLAVKIVPYAALALAIFGFMLVTDYRDGFYNRVRYGLVLAGLGSWQTRLVLLQALVFLALGGWLLLQVDAPGAGPLRALLAWWRDPSRDGISPRLGLLLVPVTVLTLLLLGPRHWLGLPGPAGKGVAAIDAAIFAASLILVFRSRIWAATLSVAGLLVLGGYGLLIAAYWPAVPGYIFGFSSLAGPVGTFGIAVQGAALLGLGLWLAPRVMREHLAPTTDPELAARAQRLTERVETLTQSRSNAVDTAAAELRRIERDLHDGAQARMVAVGMSLQAAERLFASNPQAALALVAEAKESSSRALTELRDLVRGIYPPVLADRGLGDAIKALALDTPLPVTLDVELPGTIELPVASAVYFSVAEALANVVKHAEARSVHIDLSHRGGVLRAEVSDNGAGGADAASGTGLAGVERRLATFDGILAVSSPPGGPTIVVIEVPCASSSAKTSSC
ncbi:MAG TPA: histidine kinase [Streptosporangiaceae bacterium]|nr:histidine kinase [Streptosporangiaceae bacterium]